MVPRRQKFRSKTLASNARSDPSSRARSRTELAACTLENAVLVSPPICNDPRGERSGICSAVFLKTRRSSFGCDGTCSRRISREVLAPPKATQGALAEKPGLERKDGV
jgi:hypothetical protein